MARHLLAPTSDQKQTEIKLGDGRTRRYTGKDGVYSVVDSDVAVLKESGFTEKSLTGTIKEGTGFRCSDCGFGSFFTTCSRCGGTCQKEHHV